MKAEIWDAPTMLAKCIGSALATDSPNVMKLQLKDGIEYSDRKQNESMREFQERAMELRPSRPHPDDITLHRMFVETWGSTALGFGGMGGSAMTDAYTVVLIVGWQHYLVYWHGIFAYRINTTDVNFNAALFHADINSGRTRERASVGDYYKPTPLTANK